MKKVNMAILIISLSLFILSCTNVTTSQTPSISTKKEANSSDSDNTPRGEILGDMQSIRTALLEGYRVRRTFFYKLCDFFIGDQPISVPLDSKGYGELIPFDIREKENKEFMIETEKSPMVSIYDYDTGRQVYQYNYGLMRIHQSGFVNLDVRTYVPPTMSQKMHETFHCKVGRKFNAPDTSSIFMKMPGKPIELFGFKQIQNAAARGETPRIVVNYNKCDEVDSQGKVLGKGPKVTAGLELKTSEYFGDEFKMPPPIGENATWLSISKTSISMNDSGKSSWKYTKMRIYSNNILRVIPVSLSLEKYEEISKTTYRCKMSEATSQEAVRAFYIK